MKEFLQGVGALLKYLVTKGKIGIAVLILFALNMLFSGYAVTKEADDSRKIEILQENVVKTSDKLQEMTSDIKVQHELLKQMSDNINSLIISGNGCKGSVQVPRRNR